MNDHVWFVLELAVKAGQLGELQDVMREMVALAQNEPGTLNYEWFLTDDGATCHIHERYANVDAVMAHGAFFPEELNQRFLAFQPTRLTLYGKPTDALRVAVSSFAPLFLQPMGGFTR